MPRTHAFLCLSLVLLSGCGAGWHRVEATPATVIPARKQVRVYHGAGVERWHAVTLAGDSITGIQWLKPVECESCRTALPLAGVDSIEVGDPPAGFRKSVGLALGIMLGVLWFTCHQSTACTST